MNHQLLETRNLVNEALVQMQLGRPESTPALLRAALRQMDKMLGQSYPIPAVGTGEDDALRFP